MQEVQNQLRQSIEPVRLLGVELGTANQKLTYLENDRVAKEAEMKEVKAAIMNMIANQGASQGGGGRREETISLVNVKTMAPKPYDGKMESGFRTWAKKVRSYCNGNRPGFKRFLKWIENQEAPINPVHMPEVDWKYKEAANDVLFDFIMLHTSDGAQNVVELCEDNGCEAWRQLCKRYDPVGESYVLDQMGALMEVERCVKMMDFARHHHEEGARQ